MDSEHDRIDGIDGIDGIDDELNAAADSIERATGMLDEAADPIEVLDDTAGEEPESDFQEETPLELRAEGDDDDVRADASDTVRSEVTILFSDIEGSTSYFERKGDEEGLAMVQHHNDLLFPVIENEGGRVVKTIGDGIMACFKDPVSAVRAAIGMQRALEADREMTFDEDDHIHIRVALHMGPGIEKDNDVYGDVVNAAAKVQQQAQPDQILVTEVLRESAKQAGAQCAKLGRAEMKGKDEALDVYAVAWSALASEQLLGELQTRYEERIRELRKEKDRLEEELETSGEQWRAERRRLTGEIEELEAEVEQRAKEAVGLRSSEDLQAQVRFQLEEATRVKEQLEQELVAAQARWEVERKRLQAQVDSLQGAALEAMAQTNNPARLALAIRDQVDARLKDAREQWQMQWDGERRRLLDEIERLKNAVSAAPTLMEDKKELARRGLLQKLGKSPVEAAPVTAGWGGGGKTPAQWESEFREARAKWELERDQMTMKVNQLERESQLQKDSIRQEVFQELRGQYEPRLESYERERKRLKDDLEAVTAQLADERQRLSARIEHLERSLPEAQEAARTQVIAELRADYETKMEEINRMRARSERRAQDALEESEAALRRAKKEIARLQEELREAKETAFRARKVRSSSASTPNL